MTQSRGQLLLVSARTAIAVAVLGACASSAAIPEDDTERTMRDWAKVDPRRERVSARALPECGPVFGTREVASPDALLQELAGILQWISALRKTGDVSIEAWCRWGIEKEEGLRASMPATTPPPAHDLPRVANLIGLSRDRITDVLGHPYQGCQRSHEGQWVAYPCTDATELDYWFFHLSGGPGGGPELLLTFDSSNTCVGARWIRSQ
jgi:hypothetical protein